MIARNLINDTISPLRPTDDGAKAITWMTEFHLAHLPVVNEMQEFIGLVSELDVLDVDQAEDHVYKYELSSPNIHVNEYDHIYEVLKKMNEHRQSVMPVISSEGKYLGAVTLETLMDSIANANAIQAPGGIIILEMNYSDYSLSEIARIVETNHARILSMYVTSPEHSTEMEVTLKVNRTDIQSIIATFERYEYTIKASYQEQAYMEDMQGYYDAFMNYLNM